MADLIINDEAVITDSTSSITRGKLGATCTAGQPVFADRQDGWLLKPCFGPDSSKARAVGILATGGERGQSCWYLHEGGLDFGTAILTPGERYYVSSQNTGGIMPSGDLDEATKAYITFLGVATSTTRLAVQRVSLDVQSPLVTDDYMYAGQNQEITEYTFEQAWCSAPASELVDMLHAQGLVADAIDIATWQAAVDVEVTKYQDGMDLTTLRADGLMMILVDAREHDGSWLVEGGSHAIERIRTTVEAAFDLDRSILLTPATIANIQTSDDFRSTGAAVTRKYIISWSDPKDSNAVDDPANTIVRMVPWAGWWGYQSSSADYVGRVAYRTIDYNILWHDDVPDGHAAGICMWDRPSWTYQSLVLDNISAGDTFTLTYTDADLNTHETAPIAVRLPTGGAPNLP